MRNPLVLAAVGAGICFAAIGAMNPHGSTSVEPVLAEPAKQVVDPVFPISQRLITDNIIRNFPNLSAINIEQWRDAECRIPSHIDGWIAQKTYYNHVVLGTNERLDLNLEIIPPRDIPDGSYVKISGDFAVNGIGCLDIFRKGGRAPATWVGGVKNWGAAPSFTITKIEIIPRNVKITY